MKVIFLLALFSIVIISGALADDVITLKLDAPSFKSESNSSNPAAASKPKVTTVSSATPKNKTTGRVGLVVAESAKIYASRSSKARVFASCAKDTPLAIVSTAGSWYGVLMIDASTGWIPSSKVKLLDSGFTVPANVRAGALSSRGGVSDRGTSGNAIVQAAMKYMGVPYVYGGTSTTNGLDCSAFVKTVYSQFGVNLPRVSRDQAKVGVSISYSNLQPGDRLYFACKNPHVDHCGIYMGNGYFIHSSVSRGGVAVDSLTSNYYSNSLVCAMR